MLKETHRLEVRPGEGTTLKADGPARPDPGKAGLILAHGMANDLDLPLLVRVAEHLASRGHLVVRFNFLYREAGRKQADKNEVLLACLSRVQTEVRQRWALAPERLFLGGKSLGARIAAQAAGHGLEAAGLVYLGFPLHPPGRPDLGREGLLKGVGSRPQLFVAGTRDHLCPLDRLKAVLAELPGPVQLHVVYGGDHSFVLPQGAPRTEKEVHTEIAQALADWLEGLG